MERFSEQGQKHFEETLELDICLEAVLAGFDALKASWQGDQSTESITRLQQHLGWGLTGHTDKSSAFTHPFCN